MEHFKGNSQSTNMILDGKTIPDIYLKRIKVAPGHTAYLSKQDGEYKPVTWSETHRAILKLFLFFREKNFQQGDKVGILSQTRYEWNIADIAIQCAGFVTVPIYPSSGIEDVAYILEHSELRLLFVDDVAQCKKLSAVFKKTKSLPIILFNNETVEVSELNVLRWEEICSRSTPSSVQEDFEKSALQVKPQDPFSIVYTSGTTGTPKGVVLTQDNIVSELRAVVEHIHMRSDDLTLTFLPLAHILGRVESLCPVMTGFTMGFAESLNSVADNIAEVKPTLLVSVPRIYEKVYTKIQSGVEASPPVKKKLFAWAVEVGRSVARKRSQKSPIDPILMVKFLVADRLVFSKVRAKLGGRLRMTISGGAPLNPFLCEFFHACGIKILEGYGLTETTAALAANMPEDYAFGSVGKPLDGVEVKIAEDGEILVRGTVVFREYYRNPQATRESFNEGGWFCTGDIGQIDERGHLKITDRKKELIVTSAGKNIAPQKIENMIKTIRFISNVMVYGDQRNYLVAIVTVNEPEIADWAKKNSVSYKKIEELITNKVIQELYDSEINMINKQLPSYETIKKFRLLPKDFTIETGELTPSMKVKRKVVSERYKNLLDEMYP